MNGEDKSAVLGAQRRAEADEIIALCYVHLKAERTDRLNVLLASESMSTWVRFFAPRIAASISLPRADIDVAEQIIRLAVVHTVEHHATKQKMPPRQPHNYILRVAETLLRREFDRDQEGPSAMGMTGLTNVRRARASFAKFLKERPDMASATQQEQVDAFNEQTRKKRKNVAKSGGLVSLNDVPSPRVDVSTSAAWAGSDDVFDVAAREPVYGPSDSLLGELHVRSIIDHAITALVDSDDDVAARAAALWLDATGASRPVSEVAMLMDVKPSVAATAIHRVKTVMMAILLGEDEASA